MFLTVIHITKNYNKKNIDLRQRMSWLLTRRRTLHNVISGWSGNITTSSIFECTLRLCMFRHVQDISGSVTFHIQITSFLPLKKEERKQNKLVLQ